MAFLGQLLTEDLEDQTSHKKRSHVTSWRASLGFLSATVIITVTKEWREGFISTINDTSKPIT